jgi:hypothetical protein
MLDQIKRLLGFTDSENDDLLTTIISLTESRLKNRLGGANIVPDALNYIVVEVSVIRFNRIGSEGLSSHTVEGESMSWPDSDFDRFSDDIDAYLEEHAGTKRGMVRFL